MAPGPSASTSRAFWEAKAEQVMDRVFSQADWTAPPAEGQAPQPAAGEPPAIEVEVRDASPPPRPWRLPLERRPWLLGLSCGLVVLATGGSLALWRGWREASSDLRQERTLRLLESVRALAPAAQPAAGAAAGTAATAGNGLPPPPPQEPWIEELGQLQGGAASGGGSPLRVPLNGPLNSPPPEPSPAAAGGGGTAAAAGGGAAPLPELLGVVQIPGKPGSAIFQVGGSSTNALVGEAIGGSGWRLQSTASDSAVIERGGVSRRISISSGF